MNVKDVGGLERIIIGCLLFFISVKLVNPAETEIISVESLTTPVIIRHVGTLGFLLKPQSLNAKFDLSHDAIINSAAEMHSIISPIRGDYCYSCQWHPLHKLFTLSQVRTHREGVYAYSYVHLIDPRNVEEKHVMRTEMGLNYTGVNLRELLKMSVSRAMQAFDGRK